MKEFNLALISKYRTLLMGIGILDVLIWHFANAHQLEGISSQFFGTITRFVFTPGFLFLTGFGIYYSYSKDSNIKQFYLRRFSRLVVPFWIIVTSIFVLRYLISGVGNLPYYLGMITTLSFWIPNISFNYWYIAVIFIFYLFYPLIHYYVFGSYNNRNKSDLILY